jgi:hypothetical protein
MARVVANLILIILFSSNGTFEHNNVSWMEGNFTKRLNFNLGAFPA